MSTSADLDASLKAGSDNGRRMRTNSDVMERCSTFCILYNSIACQPAIACDMAAFCMYCRCNDLVHVVRPTMAQCKPLTSVIQESPYTAGQTCQPSRSVTLLDRLVHCAG